MPNEKLHKYQERFFDISIKLTYIMLLFSIMGLSGAAPKYFNIFEYYLRIYICLFLIWRFNPFRTYYEFTNLDRKISFSAGLFILTTTVLNEFITKFKKKLSSKLERNYVDISVNPQ